MRTLLRCLLVLSVAASACTSSSGRDSCEESNAAVCDFFLPGLMVVSAPGGPLLSDVQVTRGSCYVHPSCPSGCDKIFVSGSGTAAGDFCDLVATSTDGRSEIFRVAIVQLGPPERMCCADASGAQWVTFPVVDFDQTEVVVDFNPDGGVADTGVPPADGPPMCRTPSPDYGPTSVFSFLPSGTPAATTTCPAACGDSAWPALDYPNIDTALPYGSCEPGTPSCEAGGRIPCGCNTSSGPIHDFTCSCEGGAWICRIRTAGMAMCMPCPDAGASSPTDAPNLCSGITTNDAGPIAACPCVLAVGDPSGTSCGNVGQVCNYPPPGCARIDSCICQATDAGYRWSCLHLQC
jgi:hypothetical protein